MLKIPLPQLFVFFLLSLSHALFAQLDVNPGVDRWKIKTSILPGQPQSMTIAEMMELENPITVKEKLHFEKVRIPKTVGHQFQEGNLITLVGWLHLVALEDDAKKHRDGDYHIQIRATATWGDSCIVVEVPYPEFIADPQLKAQCQQVRAFVRDTFLAGHEPSIGGKKITHPKKVRITGQLFFDAIHMNGKPRGKQKMHAYTCWEIHPITAMELAD